jgi:preprotein translocase subunit Sss1
VTKIAAGWFLIGFGVGMIVSVLMTAFRITRR